MDSHLGLVKDMSYFVTGMDAKLVTSIFFVPMVFESIYQVD
jgi:NhaP-type Na+/H+ or K+/H+ antiporter